MQLHCLHISIENFWRADQFFGLIVWFKNYDVLLFSLAYYYYRMKCATLFGLGRFGFARLASYCCCCCASQDQHSENNQGSNARSTPDTMCSAVLNHIFYNPLNKTRFRKILIECAVEKQNCIIDYSNLLQTGTLLRTVAQKLREKSFTRALLN